MKRNEVASGLIKDGADERTKALKSLNRAMEKQVVHKSYKECRNAALKRAEQDAADFMAGKATSKRLENFTLNYIAYSPLLTCSQSDNIRVLYKVMFRTCVEELRAKREEECRKHPERRATLLTTTT